jgi:hypothetical protein
MNVSQLKQKNNRHSCGGRNLLNNRYEIPACAGMTGVLAGMTGLVESRLFLGMTRFLSGMTGKVTGMTVQQINRGLKC